MNYEELNQLLQENDYLRVEKDDRLLDILPDNTRRYGIELWDKWSNDTVHIIRLHVPFNVNKAQIFSIPRTQIEQSLQKNTPFQLSKVTPQAEKQEVFNNL